MKKNKKGHTFHIHIDDKLKQVFIGHHTLFSVLGFTIGGILVGEMLARILSEEIGVLLTLAIGLVIFLVAAFVGREFKG